MNDRVGDLRTALALDGFTFATRAPSGIEFRGSVSARGRTAKLRIVYADLTFARIPQIFIDNPEVLDRGVFPHLDEANELCVVDRDRYVADRYNVAGVARGLVVRAREVIERGFTAGATDEIAAEFPQHWGGLIAGCAFDPGYAGSAEHRLSSEGHATIAAAPQQAGRASREKKQTPHLPAFVIHYSGQLSFTATQVRPRTFGELITWADAWDRALAESIVENVVQIGARDAVCVIAAANGIVGGIIGLSSKPPAVIEAMSRPQAWAGFVRRGLIDDAPFVRIRGRYMSLDYALNRNYGDAGAPLNALKVLLIGCGAIGGYLARDLSQMGAGRRGGLFVLLDKDSLDSTNLGRHWLGVDCVGRNKAEACKRKIDAELPGSVIAAWPVAIEDRLSRFAEFDLVIDATGEHDVSDLLNELRLAGGRDGKHWPTLLHTWIEGRGAAVQSYISSDPDFACYRCLDPDLHSARVTSLRPEAPRELDAGCGESTFTPYGPAAPMMAAALASVHVSDWAAGRARPLLRTRVLDGEVTKFVKDKNPDRSGQCPACNAQ